MPAFTPQPPEETFMRVNRLIPVAGLAFAVACSDTATSPTSLTPVGGPLFALTAGQTFTDANALTTNTPSGGHLQTGTIQCVVNLNLSITCSSYEVAGIGNANAQADLALSYSATVDCRNHGGKVVPVKASAQTAPISTGQLEPKNGKLTVPQLSSGAAPSDGAFTANATCPNGNWTKEVQEGTITLSSFTYTLTFAGFTAAAVTITGS
jgi:hypothetical protein